MLKNNQYYFPDSLAIHKNNEYTYSCYLPDSVYLQEEITICK